MESVVMDMDYYKNKSVFVTGHTGFKGTWLCKMLLELGAKVTGYSLEPPSVPSLFNLSGIEDDMVSIISDIRDLSSLRKAFNKANPEIVFHLAAQPIVRDSYDNPHYTYETNVMGTVNILENVRMSSTVRSVVNVTTDKVYQNNEWLWGYREIDYLDGYDPYSNSKSCSELITNSYKRCFLDNKVAVSTARAGNVIGGGDFARDRIIPDCVRAVLSGSEIEVRNPFSIRPYQHVLEPLVAYLTIAETQAREPQKSGCYNVGPNDKDCLTTGELVDLFCKYWGAEAKWNRLVYSNKKAVHEANCLKLDCTKIKNTLNWEPKWSIEESVEKTCLFYKGWVNGDSVSDLMSKQIKEYLGDDH